MSASSPLQLGISDDPAGARVNLRDCLQAALQQSEGMFDKVLESLSGSPDKLFGAVVKPNFPPPVQTQLLALLSHRSALTLSFNKQLREYVFMGVGADRQSPQTMRFEDLKLFEEEDLDESIEIARALQEMGQQVDEVLPALDALLSTLLGWTTVQSQINPLRPEMFARALRECLAHYIEDSELRGALLSPASARMGIILRKLYIDLIAWLKSSGVEAAVSTPPSQVQSSVARPGVTATVGNSVARTLLTLDRLRRLLSGELDGDASRKPLDFLHTVPASVVALQDMRQVEAMVRRLESKAVQAAKNPAADAARKKAAARLALKDGKHLGQQLGEEVVLLMLDNLIEDERLLPQVRAQLQTMEPLLVQIAQTDGRFFSDKQHAARQFLDKVTGRSLAFSTERDDGYKAFVQSVERSIAQLSTKVDAGVQVSKAFGDVIGQLAQAWAAQDAQEKARREEAARALMHAEQRNMLAQYLAQEFRSNAEGVDVPRNVVDFACGPWAQTVAEAQLRCTDGTSDPLGYHELVTELYWSVQARVAKRNRRRLVQIIPGMLGKLRQGLQLIEFPPERISDFFAELISLHEASLEGGKRAKTPDALAIQHASNVFDAPDSIMSDDNEGVTNRAELEALYAASSMAPLAPTGTASEEVVAKIETPTSAASTGGPWLAKQEAFEAGFVEEESISVMPTEPEPSAPPAMQTATPMIALGTWVEMMLEGQWVRAQLTWASPHRSLFMFVSRGGKAHSMSQRTMDKLRAQGHIRVVSDGHLVEKALDAVAQTALRNSAVQPPSPT